MSTAKKRKIDCEGRVINSEWCKKYFVIPHNQGGICLVFQNTIAVIKEYIILTAITQLSTPFSLIKLLVRHE